MVSKDGIKSGAKKALTYFTGIAAGGGIGYGASKIGEIVADANVKVRPELANIGFWDAFWASHPLDWLFYHYPSEMETTYVILGAMVGTAVAYKITK